MTRGPITEPGMGVLPAGAIASTVGGAIWAAANCWYSGVLEPRTFAVTMIVSAIIGMIAGGLFGSTVARRLIGDEPLRWSSAALAGALIPTALALLFLLACLPARMWSDDPFPIEGWIAGIPMLALAGAVAGLTFRALHGERRIAKR